jgi:hypothetical protein
VATLRGAILEEIDFTLEATRTEQFATFLARSPELQGLVTVPAVYRQASAKRVLTLERLYGVALSDLESVRQYAPQPELALIVALNTWVSSVLTNEWFHADVHAGNLLVLTDGRVAFIDFGIVGSIPRTARHTPHATRHTPHASTRHTHPHARSQHTHIHGTRTRTARLHRAWLVGTRSSERCSHPPACSPCAAQTANAMLDFVRAFPLGDMAGVGLALEQMGFTKELSAQQSAAFAADLGEVFSSIDSMAADAASAGGGIAAGVVDETQLNRAVAAVGRVAEGCACPDTTQTTDPPDACSRRALPHAESAPSRAVRPPLLLRSDGIRFPREFALLIKQVLYFDRYTTLLAPGLDVLNDERLSMNRPPAGTTVVETEAEAEVFVLPEVLPPE